MLKGTLLAESLRIGAEVRVAGLTMTRLSRQDMTDAVTAAQPAVWTLVEFEGDDDAAGLLAAALAGSLLAEGGWYADFSVADDHVVVFAGQVFRYRRDDQAGRREAVEYGRMAGVPDHQLDWPG